MVLHKNHSSTSSQKACKNVERFQKFTTRSGFNWCISARSSPQERTAVREKRINDRSKLVPQAGRCFILLTIITSLPVTYCCVSNHLKTCLRQRFLCPGFCLAGFSWVVLLNSFEITLMAPGGGWAPARTPGRPQVCRPSGQFFLSMGSLQLNSWALFYDDSRHHRVDMEAPRLKRVKPRTSTASLLQHCVSQSTSRKQAQFKGRRI